MEWRVKYKTVLFDWDGCLAQSLAVWRDASVQALGEFGVVVTPEEVSPLLGKGGTARHFKVANHEACTIRLREIAAEQLKTVQLYPGVKEALIDLAARKNLAIVSSCRARILDDSMSLHDLHDYFQIVLSGESVTEKKPHPEAINTALAALGCAPHEAVMVGDSVSDIKAANAAGVDSLLFYPPSHKTFYKESVFDDVPEAARFSHFSQLSALIA